MCFVSWQPFSKTLLFICYLNYLNTQEYSPGVNVVQYTGLYSKPFQQWEYCLWAQTLLAEGAAACEEVGIFYVGYIAA